jgi:hypothetical protein
MRLSFIIAAGPSQQSHSHVCVPRDSWPHFTVSDSRLQQYGGGGAGPLFISPKKRVARLYSQTLGSLFVASCDSQGYGGGIWPRLHMGSLLCESQSHMATDGQSVSQSVLVSSPIWGSWPDIYYCLTGIVLLSWGALSGKRTGLSFVRVIVCSGESFVIM